MERAVDVLRDASFWIRSLPQDYKEKWELFKKRDPSKPEAIWSKTKEPEIVIETESIEKKKGKLEKIEEFDFTKTREKLREKFDSVLAIPTEIKGKFQAKFLSDTTSKVDSLQREESSSHEIDFDSEYEIVELREHIVLVGGAAEADQGSEPASKVDVYDTVLKEWREIAPLPVKTTACYATSITGKCFYIANYKKYIDLWFNSRYPTSCYFGKHFVIP